MDSLIIRIIFVLSNNHPLKTTTMQNIIIDSIELVNETVNIGFARSLNEDVEYAEMSITKFVKLMCDNHEMYFERQLSRVDVYSEIQTSEDDFKKELKSNMCSTDFFDLVLENDYLFVTDTISNYLKHNHKF